MSKHWKCLHIIDILLLLGYELMIAKIVNELPDSARKARDGYPENEGITILHAQNAVATTTECFDLYATRPGASAFCRLG